MPQFLASCDMSATGAVSRALPPRPSFAPFLHSNFLSQPPPHLDPSLCLSPPPHVPLWPGLSCPASVTWGVFPLLGHLGWAPSRAVTGGLPGQSWDFLCELQSARSFLMPRRHFKVKHVSADSFRLAPRALPAHLHLGSLGDGAIRSSPPPLGSGVEEEGGGSREIAARPPTLPGSWPRPPPGPFLHTRPLSQGWSLRAWASGSS